MEPGTGGRTAQAYTEDVGGIYAQGACLVCYQFLPCQNQDIPKKIWLSFGSCLEIGHCNQNFGKLLETSETLKEKRLLVGTKPNEYLNFFANILA